MTASGTSAHRITVSEPVVAVRVEIDLLCFYNERVELHVRDELS